MRKDLKADDLGQTEDWLGNNAAFTCPACFKVFIVSARFAGGRDCPKCGKSKATICGGRKSGGTAYIEWVE